MHAFTSIAGTTRTPRRILVVLITAVMAMGVTAAPLTSPAHAAETVDRGLFGSQDPTYDGVDRQATAILGLVAVNAKVPPLASSWLLRQQCEDGSFSAYRADLTRPCMGPDLVNYTGPNTNSTALAAMALSALATQNSRESRVARQAARKAVAWLVAQQQADGGWEWLAGLGSDSTSTAMALTAIAKPKSTSHRRGWAFLDTTMQAGMDCGVTFTADSPIIDPLSTSWTFLASQGSPPYSRYRGPRKLTPCSPTQTNVRASGSWLASELTKGAGQIPSAFEPGQTDWNSTALATLGMTQRDGSTREMRLGLAALKANVSAYVEVDGVDRATPLGTLLVIAHASGADPEDFGGINLSERLLATLQK